MAMGASGGSGACAGGATKSHGIGSNEVSASALPGIAGAAASSLVELPDGQEANGAEAVPAVNVPLGKSSVLVLVAIASGPGHLQHLPRPRNAILRVIVAATQPLTKV